AQAALLGERDCAPGRPLLRGPAVRTVERAVDLSAGADHGVRLAAALHHPGRGDDPVARARLAPPPLGGGRGMIVRAEHLNKWYGRVIALNDVSMKIEPGITGLLGPNGA